MGKAILGPRITGNLRHWEERRRLARRRRKLGDRSMMSYDRALGWITRYSQPGGGVAQTSRSHTPYPEVTGYLIPTLFQFGDRDLAMAHAGWLRRQQRSDGSIPGPNGRPYTFDTGQALRGFLAALESDQSFEVAAAQAAEFVVSNISPEGEIHTPVPDDYVWSNGRRLPDTYLIYTLPPLFSAARLMGRKDWEDAAHHALDHYLQRPDRFDPDQLSHFYAYIIEALVDLGEIEPTRVALERLFESMRSDGSLPAYPNAGWTCSTGNIQFALIGYKLGLRDRAERLYQWAERMQSATGGFLGSYGRGAAYSANEEISWAVKYFLDATLWRVKTGFNSEARLHPETLEASDSRLSVLVKLLGDLNGQKVVDLGCGKGRFGKALLSRFSNCELSGVDGSEAMLRSVDGAFPVKAGSMLHLPFDPVSFDVAYAIESFEHVLNVRGALHEVYRRLKPGGRFVVIDKDSCCLGAVDLAPWEKWLSPAALRQSAQEAGFETVRQEQFTLTSDSPITFFAILFRKDRVA